MIDSGFHDALKQAKKMLSASPLASVRALEVCREGDGFALRGAVSSYYHKQLAQETVRSATRGLQVVNRVQVD